MYVLIWRKVTSKFGKYQLRLYCIKVGHRWNICFMYLPNRFTLSFIEMSLSIVFVSETLQIEMVSRLKINSIRRIELSPSKHRVHGVVRIKWERMSRIRYFVIITFYLILLFFLFVWSIKVEKNQKYTHLV